MGDVTVHPTMADVLCARLLDGTYPPHEKLPSTRQLAREFNISQSTMSKIIAALQADGLVWTNRLGVFATDAASSSGHPLPPREAFTCFGIPEDVVDGILDVYAHQLAEKQRAKLIADGYGPLDKDDDGLCPCGGCSWCLAQDYIDLIDPESREEHRP